MQSLFTIALTMAASVAQAHESFAPHHHPHATSWLPSTELVGVAALILALAVIAYTQMRRG